MRRGRRFRHRFQGPHSGSLSLIGQLSVRAAAPRGEVLAGRRPAAAAVAGGQGRRPGGRPMERGRAAGLRGPGKRRPGARRVSPNFDGHQLATSFVGFDFDGWSLVQATDVPPECLDVRPDEHRYGLHVPGASTVSFIPAGNVWHAVKTWRDLDGLRGRRRRAEAGRAVRLRSLGGRYKETRQRLQQAFRYGLTDSLVVWHNWQRWGDHYRLPDIFPPNPERGTMEDLRVMTPSTDAGVLFALHDNYIDFYPDAEGFSYDRLIAFRQDGTPVPAWLNRSRAAQSYRYRADAVEPFLRRNLKEIRDAR